MISTLTITDCDGKKFTAIQQLFMGQFKKNIEVFETSEIETGLKIKTPLLNELFLTAIKARLEALQATQIGQEASYFSSIQRGYFFESGIYHLKAIVGIAHKNNGMSYAYTSTVPIDREVSEKKYYDPELNIGKLLAEKFPDFVFGSSVYEYLTKEDEVLWLQQPLRHCLKELLR